MLLCLKKKEIVLKFSEKETVKKLKSKIGRKNGDGPGVRQITKEKEKNKIEIQTPGQ